VVWLAYQISTLEDGSRANIFVRQWTMPIVIKVQLAEVQRKGLVITAFYRPICELCMYNLQNSVCHAAAGIGIYMKVRQIALKMLYQ
jgi:hypothetical protein